MHPHETSVNDASSIVGLRNVDRNLFFNCFTFDINFLDAVNVLDLRFDDNFCLRFDDLYPLRGLCTHVVVMLFAGNAFAVELAEKEYRYAREQNG